METDFFIKKKEYKDEIKKMNISFSETDLCKNAINKSWQKIPPLWPLKSAIAVNPLYGMENKPIEQALLEAAIYFENDNLSTQMELINLHTIKWCQAFFDEGQATITMPFRDTGFYQAFLALVQFDDRLHAHDEGRIMWLKSLPESATEAIAFCLSELAITSPDWESFLTLLLTSLPGWAAYTRYRTHWSKQEKNENYPINEADYLAVRIVITTLLWPKAISILEQPQAKQEAKTESTHLLLNHLTKTENEFQQSLLKKISEGEKLGKKKLIPDAQLIFCIDVRSEPFRHCLEKKGNYETFGFAGFFGIPVKIDNSLTGDSYNACPVLITPSHTILQKPCANANEKIANFARSALKCIKQAYQSLKYNFTTPLVLVEAIGPFCALWVALKTFMPITAEKIKIRLAQFFFEQPSTQFTLETMSLSEQRVYARNVLGMMGLTSNFSPIVVLCGHGSTTRNNAYATTLDCGACGGSHGGNNARILAAILNNPIVRAGLEQENIAIPETTCFIAAEHDTTTHAVKFFSPDSMDSVTQTTLSHLKADLLEVQKDMAKERVRALSGENVQSDAVRYLKKRSLDWAEVRSEWGLAGNAAFIVASRSLTNHTSLHGRVFLHSYDWQLDNKEGDFLTTILTAPMVVAQWINSQYLFSTLNNVAYGSGSKITQNITGKIGVMQGNASDLMQGLPLQSVNKNDIDTFHIPARLLTVVYAPRNLLDKIIAKQEILKKLFGHGWVNLVLIEPDSNRMYQLMRTLTWKEI